MEQILFPNRARNYSHAAIPVKGIVGTTPPRKGAFFTPLTKLLRASYHRAAILVQDSDFVEFSPVSRPLQNKGSWPTGWNEE